jgi:phenylacetate-CoA ligase
MLELTSGTTAERFPIAADPEYRERMVDALAVRNRHVRDVFKRIRDVRVCYICSPLFDDDEVPLGAHGRALPRQRRMRGKGTLRFDAPGNIFTLPPEKLDQMIAEARAFAPGIFFGDPVHLSVLANHVRATRARLPRLEFVMTAFELCSDVSRKIIQDVFDCPVYDLYSATEFASAAVECDRGQYHVYDEAFIVEILAGGQPVAPGGLGQMVVTTLEKTCAPLLRYETGDLARTSAVPCSCAFSHCVSLSSIEGRVQDVISDATGAMVTPRAVDRAVAGASGFLFYGLVQVSDERYLLQIIPDDTFSPATTRRLGGRLHELLGPSASIDIETVPFLTPAPSGKFRLCRALHEGHTGHEG